MPPARELTPAKLSMVFDAIDTQDGTANVMEVSAPDAGAPHITVRLLARQPSLHGDEHLGFGLSDVGVRRQGQPRERNFKAVHTRHEFTPTRLTGWTSRPEQYYGQCEAAK